MGHHSIEYIHSTSILFHPVVFPFQWWMSILSFSSSPCPSWRSTLLMRLVLLLPDRTKFLSVCLLLSYPTSEFFVFEISKCNATHSSSKVDFLTIRSPFHPIYHTTTTGTCHHGYWLCLDWRCDIYIINSWLASLQICYSLVQQQFKIQSRTHHHDCRRGRSVSDN